MDCICNLVIPEWLVVCVAQSVLNINKTTVCSCGHWGNLSDLQGIPWEEGEVAGSDVAAPQREVFSVWLNSSFIIYGLFMASISIRLTDLMTLRRMRNCTGADLLKKKIYAHFTWKYDIPEPWACQSEMTRSKHRGFVLVWWPSKVAGFLNPAVYIATERPARLK